MTENDRLVRIETKLDVLIAQGQDHEKRIRWIERLGALSLAVAGAITTVNGMIP